MEAEAASIQPFPAAGMGTPEMLSLWQELAAYVRYRFSIIILIFAIVGLFCVLALWACGGNSPAFEPPLKGGSAWVGAQVERTRAVIIVVLGGGALLYAAYNDFKKYRNGIETAK